MRLYKPNFKKILRTCLTIFTNTVTVVAVVVGSVGLFLAYINPIPWIAHYFPIQLNNILWTGVWVNITGEQKLILMEGINIILQTGRNCQFMLQLDKMGELRLPEGRI